MVILALGIEAIRSVSHGIHNLIMINPLSKTALMPIKFQPPPPNHLESPKRKFDG